MEAINVTPRLTGTSANGSWTAACAGTDVEERRWRICVHHDPTGANASAYLHIIVVPAGSDPPEDATTTANFTIGSRGTWSEDIGCGAEVYVQASTGTSNYVVTQYTR